MTTQLTDSGDDRSAQSHPVAVDGHLEPQLRRWMPFVKWLLAAPHWLVLTLLAPLALLATFVASLAILVTGRYPRALFEFTAGALRWWWRVVFYCWVLGTDRYPPFTLGEAPDYPASFDIPYPERLSRIRMLFKWVLATPHLVMLGFLFGSGGYSLALLLALLTAVVMLINGVHPRSVFEVQVGCFRWLLRVTAYLALMTDKYPPFTTER